MNYPSGTNGKHTLRNSRKNGLFSISALTLVFILTLSACGKKETAEKSYPDAKAALTDYCIISAAFGKAPCKHELCAHWHEISSFSSNLSKKKSATTEQLIESANEWQAIDANVSMALVKESALPADSLNAMRYIAIRDSISETIDRLVDSKARTLSDYVEIAKNVKPVETDSATLQFAESIHRFYATMDGKATYGKDAKGTIAAYSRLLAHAEAEGFSSKEDVLSFLREEDTAFRSFLERLPELGALELDGIRDGTTAVMGNVVRLAALDTPLLAAEEVVVLMTMRTSRRLLQNALQCVNDIRMKKVRGEDQATAYQWMLIQPWITFDGFAYSLMSDAQWKTLTILATETPKCLVQIKATDFPIPLDDLPGLLIKAHLSTL